jgi:Clr5 domain
MDQYLVLCDQQALTEAPFNKKWAILKPYIEDLYIKRNFTVKQIAEILKKQLGFDAKYILLLPFRIQLTQLTFFIVFSESQYKYQINRKWRLEKNLSTHKKSDICLSLYRNGFNTENIRRDLIEKLLRHIRTSERNGIALFSSLRESLVKEQAETQHDSTYPMQV